MRLVFLYKYMNCTVDQNTGTDTGCTTYIKQLKTIVLKTILY